MSETKAAAGRPDVVEKLDVLDELEAMRAAPYPNPADADRGEVLMATGVGVGLLGVGVVAAAAICPPCMLGAAPLAAVAAPSLMGAGLFKRWRRRRREQASAAFAEPEKTS